VSEGRIGVDESGKGDYFGPLVVAACFVGPEHLAELEGVKDSKKLTDPVALRLSDRIRVVCPCSVISIGPEKYNELYAKFKNLNALLAWGHARAIENVLEIQPSETVISDQFSAGGTLVKKALFEKGKLVDFQSRVRAEEDMAVAAASILARAEFLRSLRKLSATYEIDLPKGATNVIGPGKRAVARLGPEILRKIAKLHFKTTGQILSGSPTGYQ
jgi:ribonuclease HIII